MYADLKNFVKNRKNWKKIQKKIKGKQQGKRNEISKNKYLRLH